MPGSIPATSQLDWLMAVLGPVDDPAFVEKTWQDLAARDLGVTLLPVGINSAGDLDTAFESMKKSEAEAVMPTRSSLTFNLGLGR